MELKDILSITGQPGLYKYIAQSKTGMIVESIENQKRMNAYASQKISSLEDIAIFTNEKEMPLAEVLKKMYMKKKAARLPLTTRPHPKIWKNILQNLFPITTATGCMPHTLKKLFRGTTCWFSIRS
jgi:hypothetical protein